MKENIEKIQAVIGKLQEMEIQATYNNMMCLLASINTLTQVSDYLTQKMREETSDASNEPITLHAVEASD